MLLMPYNNMPSQGFTVFQDRLQIFKSTKNVECKILSSISFN